MSRHRSRSKRSGSWSGRGVRVGEEHEQELVGTRIKREIEEEHKEMVKEELIQERRKNAFNHTPSC